jgi:ribosomal protein L37E
MEILNKICRKCGISGNSFQEKRRVCTKCRSKDNRIRMKLIDYNYYELNKEKVLAQQKKHYLFKKEEKLNSLVIL